MGLKVTTIVQEPFIATEAPQLLVCEKELAPDPVIETPPLRVSGPVPGLLRVMPCVAAAEFTGVLGNERLAGRRLAPGTCPAPLTTTWIPSV